MGFKLVLIPIFLIVSLVFSQGSEITIMEGDIEGISSSIMKSADTAYNLNLKGLKLLDELRFDEAEKCFEEASKIVPNYTDAENNLAVSKWRRGLVSEAFKIWDSIVKRDRGYYIAWYNLGLMAKNEGKIIDAEGYLSNAIAENQKFHEAYTMLGQIYLNGGDYKKSEHMFSKALSISPNNSNAYLGKAYALILVKDTTSAVKLLKKHQKNAEALKMLSNIYRNRLDYKTAFFFLDKAMALSQDPQLFLMAADIKFMLKLYDDATYFIKKYMTKCKNISADAYLTAAMIAKENGMISTAERYLEEGRKRFEKDKLIVYNLAMIKLFLKKYTEAEKLFSCVEGIFDDPLYYSSRADALFRIGKKELAEKFIRKAIAMDPRSDYYNKLGLILVTLGKKKEAASAFRKSISLDPENSKATLNIALIDSSAKGLDVMAKQLKKEVNNCSACAKKKKQLSIIYYRMDEDKKAIDVLESVENKTEDIFELMLVIAESKSDWNSVIIVCKEAISHGVNIGKFTYSLAGAYMRSLNYTKAVECLEKVLQKGYRKNEEWHIYYEIGYALLKLERYKESKDMLEKSLKLKSDFAPALGNISFVYEKLGYTKKAVLSTKKAIKYDTGNITNYINMALLYYNSGDFEKALDVYKKAESMENFDQAINVNIANCYESMKDYKKAFDYYKRAFGSRLDYEALYGAFVSAMKLRKISEAEEIASELNEKYRNKNYTLRALADLAFVKSDTLSVASFLEKIGDKDSTDYYLLALAYKGLKKYDKAKACLDKLPKNKFWNLKISELKFAILYESNRFSEAYDVLKNSSDTSYTHYYNLAVAAYKAERFCECISYSLKLLKVSNISTAERIDVYTILTNCSIKKKDWKSAAKYSYSVLGFDENNRDAMYNLVVALYNSGDIDKAFDNYNKLRKIDPSVKMSDVENRYKFAHAKPRVVKKVIMAEIDSLYNLALELQKKGQSDKAIKIYSDIVSRDGKYYRAWNNMGAIYGAEGNIDKAVECYENSVSRRADIADGYANLVNIYMAIDDEKNARKWLLKGLKIKKNSAIMLQMKKLYESKYGGL